jgi:hypothetical protein
VNKITQPGSLWFVLPRKVKMIKDCLEIMKMNQHVRTIDSIMTAIY